MTGMYFTAVSTLTLNVTNYCWKTAGTKSVPVDRPPEILYICTNRMWHHVSGTQSIICGIDHFC